MELCEREGTGIWAVPYLPIDPTDVGRTYESVIRINSQSGKGGVAYIMDREFGLKMPKSMHPEFGSIIQKLTDAAGRELKSARIWESFESEYLQNTTPYCLSSFNVVKRHFDNDEQASFAEIDAVVVVDGREKTITAKGNGPLDAFCAALKAEITGKFTLSSYHEHALSKSSSSKAVAYIQVTTLDGTKKWGVGIDTDIIVASIKGVLSALNR
jgi:2-isopropylmalate synthase